MAFALWRAGRPTRSYIAILAGRRAPAGRRRAQCASPWRRSSA